MGVVLFFLGLILVITVHVITHRIMDLNKKKLYVISLIFAIICSFIPTTGENKSDFFTLVYQLKHLFIMVDGNFRFIH